MERKTNQLTFLDNVIRMLFKILINRKARGWIVPLFPSKYYVMVQWIDARL